MHWANTWCFVQETPSGRYNHLYLASLWLSLNTRNLWCKFIFVFPLLIHSKDNLDWSCTTRFFLLLSFLLLDPKLCHLFLFCLFFSSSWSKAASSFSFYSVNCHLYALCKLSLVSQWAIMLSLCVCVCVRARARAVCLFVFSWWVVSCLLLCIQLVVTSVICLNIITSSISGSKVSVLDEKSHVPPDISSDPSHILIVMTHKFLLEQTKT